MLIADAAAIKVGTTDVTAVYVGDVEVWPLFVPDFHGQFRVQPGSLELRLNMDGPLPSAGTYTVQVAPYSASIPHPDFGIGEVNLGLDGKFHFTDRTASLAIGQPTTAAQAVAQWAGQRLSITLNDLGRVVAVALLGTPGEAILGVEQGYGTMTANTDFPVLTTLTGDVYVFVYRNQNLGTPTATGLEQVTATDPGSGRMSMWRVTGPNPVLRATGTSALTNWVAVKVGKGPHTGAGLSFAAANTTPQVSAPQDGGTAPVLVCYAANNSAVWTVPPGGEEVYRDTHADVRPSVMAVYFPAGPPPDADRGLSGTSRVEGAGAVWWTP